jgi:hypothetical protein
VNLAVEVLLAEMNTDHDTDRWKVARDRSLGAAATAVVGVPLGSCRNCSLARACAQEVDTGGWDCQAALAPRDQNAQRNTSAT